MLLSRRRYFVLLVGLVLPSSSKCLSSSISTPDSKNTARTHHTHTHGNGNSGSRSRGRGRSRSGSCTTARSESSLESSLESTSFLPKKNSNTIQHYPSSREYCSNCNRPLIQCLCQHIPPKNSKIKLHTKVVILQHPVEFRRKTVSTTPLLKLVLEDCKVIVGRSFDKNIALENVFEDAYLNGYIPLLLFPDDDAITLEDDDAISQLKEVGERVKSTSTNRNYLHDNHHDTTKYLLIIVDGTWTQATRMVRYSPILHQKCQTIQFKSTSNKNRSIYDAIRKQPASFCLSTLESCALTLKIIEKGNRNMEVAVNYLYDSLRAMVKIQMEQESIALEKNPGCIRNQEKVEMKRLRQKRLRCVVAADEGKVEEVGQTYDLIGFIGLNEVQCIGNGYTIRALAVKDAQYVDSRWPYRSSKSLKMIERQIDADNMNATQSLSSCSSSCCCCLGIEYDDLLVGCIVRHRNGSLGILHVDPDHRGKGLGATLLEAASQAVLHRKEKLFAYIVDGNYQSEALFTKLGWVKAEDNCKRGTGKRKAKRLWIKEYNSADVIM